MGGLVRGPTFFLTGRQQRSVVRAEGEGAGRGAPAGSDSGGIVGRVRSGPGSFCPADTLVRGYRTITGAIWPACGASEFAHAEIEFDERNEPEAAGLSQAGESAALEPFVDLFVDLFGVRPFRPFLPPG
jgi:hypothetical protein